MLSVYMVYMWYYIQPIQVTSNSLNQGNSYDVAFPKKSYNYYHDYTNYT